MSPTAMADSMMNNSKIDTQPVAKAPKKAVGKDLMRTKLCVNHLRGKCKVGIECPYAHSLSEVRSAPDLTKTRLCTKFMNGKCSRDNCSYAHGEAELKKSPNFKRKLCHWYHTTGMCRSGDDCGFVHDLSEANGEAPLEPFSTDMAMQKHSVVLGGDDSDVSTDVPPSPVETRSSLSTRSKVSKVAREVCGDFKKGKCTRGDSCRYAHVAFNDDRRAEMMSSKSTSTMKDDGPNDNRGALPEEQLFRMMAGRGSAPVNDQVKAIRLAISELQTRLRRAQKRCPGGNEEKTLQAQLAELEKVSQQCHDMESTLPPSQDPVPPWRKADSNVLASRPKQLAAAEDTPAATLAKKQRPTKGASMQSVAMRGACFALVLSLIAMVEVYLQSV